ncbi:MAG TPA: type III ribulose-bisphosphate carboxylase [Candidatus Nitrosotalea sp.]|nr:type III ribulose-bisphosphate carboxylase [Candidatus Nitrosotalea sp.]
MKGIDWYHEFVDLKYKPSKTDLVCLFRFEPFNMSRAEAAGRIASESSAGTWTTLAKLPDKIESVKAKSFEISGKFLKVAYPIDLWEPGNVPQLLSGIAGNIFGMKALKNLRLIDVSLPSSYLCYFEGPKFGIDGIRKLLKVRKRPITGAVAKPKIGWSAEEHAKIAYETWLGGFDLVKDDENLTSTQFNKFEKRVKLCSAMRDRAEKETGERKSALINITGETRQMISRARLLREFGFEYAMIDVVTSGFSSLQTMRDVCHDYKLAIHAHRAMHAAFDRNPRHGISMLMLAKICRMIGVDQLHVGTVVGKLVGSRTEVLDIRDEVTKPVVSGKGFSVLPQDWAKIRPVFPVSSGGLHPGIIPQVLEIMGNDTVLLISGGIHGHPFGTRQGATAAMQAIEATMNGISLGEYSRTRKELRAALDKWGHIRPQ